MLLYNTKYKEVCAMNLSDLGSICSIAGLLLSIYAIFKDYRKESKPSDDTRTTC